MEYSFEPIRFFSRYRWKPMFYFDLNISTHDSCTSSYGLFIFFSFRFVKGFSVCIKPVGSFRYGKA